MAFISSVGCLTPHGIGTPRLATAIERGLPCPVRDAPAGLGPGQAGWIADLAAPELAGENAPLPAREHRLRFARSSRLTRLCLIAAEEAVAGAPGRPVAERCGIALGTAFGAHLDNELFFGGLLADTASPRTFAQTLPSAAAAEVSIHLRLKGPLITLAHGSTAGLSAIAEGADLVDRGRAQWILAGAAESLGSTLLAALSEERLPAPLAEGACFFVLGPDPDRAIGRISGAGAAHGEDALCRATEAALRRAGVPGALLSQQLVFGGSAARASSQGSEASRLRRVLGDSLAALPPLAAAFVARGGQLPALIAAEDDDGIAAALCVTPA